MRALRVALPEPVPDGLAPELAKRLFFVSSAIAEFDLVAEGGVITAVDLVLSGEVAESAITAKIGKVIAAEVLTQRALPPRQVWRSPVSVESFTDPFPLLLATDAAFVAGEGQVGFGEPLLSLVDHLDARLRSIALELPRSREFRYPTLLPTSVLDRFGYFGSFPQFAMFVTRLHSDIDVYTGFVDRYRAAGRLPDDLFDQCGDKDYCLPPTMCYHTYHQYTGRQLAEEMVVTARGKSFRHESRYHTSMERLWDFTIREIVFLGGESFATECRDAVMAGAYALLEELGLAGHCEVANDHFFGNADTAGKILSQRMMELKFELRVPVAADRTIAVGSFNLHGHFFGESFGITGPDGAGVASGCVGFGLERLAYAFLCQHGTDPAGWPTSVTDRIGDPGAARSHR
ncbi:hypothetical protein [Actinokineospora cianjurensis]|uniref:Aminoacyl-transfer RNA synthetases class-II family profile domain-containing protein n=1 Tax=Actinokineospora cianjurensis TaxID=585224 RepID=A0A421BAF6_9PSEU|nr:hypothetical protein [Actinokineospora cianjurensis]RLK61354.1 hypothetical protein CLV68_1891 [Actinokineospora cianjurensis]